MIEIQEKSQCCGCAACQQVCPKGCITMKPDEEGFLYPKVDKAACVDCHLCENVCPVLHSPEERTNENQRGYLVQIKDERIRKESTSGGSFTAIASWVIERGGVVFGASLDIRKKEVAHRWVDTADGLSLFRNSKYVQSNIGNSYKETREFLKKGRWVCFSGTPCQIEGLKCFLRKDYERLVTVDVVCYGIPSPGMFRDYLSWQQQRIGGRFTKMLFREKRLSYNYTSVSIFNDQSDKDYHSGVERDKFMRSFFSDMNVRPSCYDCHFKKRYRVSDFTIWDCYDVKAFSKHFDEEGTNRMLVHTEKGEHILEAIKNDIRWEEYKDLDYFIADETAMVKSVRKPRQREAFFDDYARMDYGELMDKWFPDTWKVRMNSFLRMTAFRLGVYNPAKRIVKKILGKN